jgi:hypothetical protein
LHIDGFVLAFALILLFPCCPVPAQNKGWVQEVSFRRQARVPIIHLVHRSSMECDISLETPLQSTVEVVRALAGRCGPALFKLSAFLKVFLSQLALDAPFTGGLGSYKLYVLLAKHIERNPQLVADGENPQLGSLLLSFIKHYGDRSHLNADTVEELDGAEAASFERTSKVNDIRLAFERAYFVLSRSQRSSPDPGPDASSAVPPGETLGTVWNSLRSHSALASLLNTEHLSSQRMQFRVNCHKYPRRVDNAATGDERDCGDGAEEKAEEKDCGDAPPHEEDAEVPHPPSEPQGNSSSGDLNGRLAELKARLQASRKDNHLQEQLTGLKAKLQANLREKHRQPGQEDNQTGGGAADQLQLTLSPTGCAVPSDEPQEPAGVVVTSPPSQNVGSKRARPDDDETVLQETHIAEASKTADKLEPVSRDTSKGDVRSETASDGLEPLGGKKKAHRGKKRARTTECDALDPQQLRFDPDSDFGARLVAGEAELPMNMVVPEELRHLLPAHMQQQQLGLFRTRALHDQFCTMDEKKLNIWVSQANFGLAKETRYFGKANVREWGMMPEPPLPQLPAFDPAGCIGRLTLAGVLKPNPARMTYTSQQLEDIEEAASLKRAVEAHYAVLKKQAKSRAAEVSSIESASVKSASAASTAAPPSDRTASSGPSDSGQSSTLRSSDALSSTGSASSSKSEIRQSSVAWKVDPAVAQDGTLTEKVTEATRVAAALTTFLEEERVARILLDSRQPGPSEPGTGIGPGAVNGASAPRPPRFDPNSQYGMRLIGGLYKLPANMVVPQHVRHHLPQDMQDQLGPFVTRAQHDRFTKLEKKGAQTWIEEADKERLALRALVGKAQRKSWNIAPKPPLRQLPAFDPASPIGRLTLAGELRPNCARMSYTPQQLEDIEDAASLRKAVEAFVAAKDEEEHAEKMARKLQQRAAKSQAKAGPPAPLDALATPRASVADTEVTGSVYSDPQESAHACSTEQSRSSSSSSSSSGGTHVFGPDAWFSPEEVKGRATFDPTSALGRSITAGKAQLPHNMVVPDAVKCCLPESTQARLGPFRTLAQGEDFMARKLKKLYGYQVKQQRALGFIKRRYDATPTLRRELLPCQPDGQERPRFDPQSDFARLVMGGALPVDRNRVIYTAEHLAQIADALHLQRAVAKRIEDLEKAAAAARTATAPPNATSTSAAGVRKLVPSKASAAVAAGSPPLSSAATATSTDTPEDGASVSCPTETSNKKKRKQRTKNPSSSVAPDPQPSLHSDLPAAATHPPGGQYATSFRPLSVRPPAGHIAPPGEPPAMSALPSVASPTGVPTQNSHPQSAAEERAARKLRVSGIPRNWLNRPPVPSQEPVAEVGSSGGPFQSTQLQAGWLQPHSTPIAPAYAFPSPAPPTPLPHHPVPYHAMQDMPLQQHVYYPVLTSPPPTPHAAYQPEVQYASDATAFFFAPVQQIEDRYAAPPMSAVHPSEAAHVWYPHEQQQRLSPGPHQLQQQAWVVDRVPSPYRQLQMYAAHSGHELHGQQPQSQVMGDQQYAQQVYHQAPDQRWSEPEQFAQYQGNQPTYQYQQKQPGLYPRGYSPVPAPQSPYPWHTAVVGPSDMFAPDVYCPPPAGAPPVQFVPVTYAPQQQDVSGHHFPNTRYGGEYY